MPIIRHGYAQRKRNGSTRAYRKARAQVLGLATHCAICGQLPQPGDPLETDHILAVAHGGVHTPDNLRAAHRSCNNRRGVGYDN